MTVEIAWSFKGLKEFPWKDPPPHKTLLQKLRFPSTVLRCIFLQFFSHSVHINFGTDDFDGDERFGLVEKFSGSYTRI